VAQVASLALKVEHYSISITPPQAEGGEEENTFSLSLRAKNLEVGKGLVRASAI
jgi:hypothetical protein